MRNARDRVVMMGHWQKQTELWVEPINLGDELRPIICRGRLTRCSTSGSCAARWRAPMGAMAMCRSIR